MTHSVSCANQAEWLTERARDYGIGASEAATALGMNPHESAYTWFQRRRGELPPQTETLAMWMGHRMESIIGERYEMETGRALDDPGDYTIYRHPDHSWLFATLDRTATYEDGECGVVELKAPGGVSDEWNDTHAPLYYQIQLQIQMACAGVTRGEIVAIVGRNRFYAVPYARNDGFVKAAIARLATIRQNLIDGIPPDVDGSDSTARTLKLLHPDDNGETIELAPDYASRVELWRELKQQRSQLDKQIQTLENELRAAIGDNTYAIADGYKLSLKTQTRGAYAVPETSYRVLRQERSK